jgi:hypothetical protein
MRLVRSWLVGAACVSAVACGSTPTAPTPPAAVEQTVTLRDGPYLLALAVSETSGLHLCLGFGAAPTRAEVRMSLHGMPDGWIAQAATSDVGTMTMSLRVSNGSLTGTLSGSGRDVTTTASVDVSGTQGTTAASLSGIPRIVSNGTVASGAVDGSVTFSSPTGSTSCNANTWTFTPQ